MTVGTKHARFGTPRTSAEEGGETQRSHSGQLLEVVRRETVPRCITLRRGYSNPTLRTLAGAGRRIVSIRIGRRHSLERTCSNR
jgi:hypothetical protein